MRTIRPLSLRLAPAAVALAVLLLPLSSASGQDPVNVGYSDLEKEYLSFRQIMPGLFKGQIQFELNDKEHVKAIDCAVRWAVYRFFLEEYHKVGSADATKTINRLHQDFDLDLRYIADGKEKMKELGPLYGKKVALYGKKVMEVQAFKPIAKVNVARVLARSAVLGQGELADVLVDLLQDANQNDGVKYYALQGLSNLFNLPMQEPPVLNRDRQAKAIKAVIEFVNRKAAFTAVTGPDEVEGFRVLRREAIRALAACRIPAINDTDRPALVLLRVVAREDFEPKLRMDERIEAAIGLARMRMEKNSNYQPDYAAQQIALFLDEFTTWVQEERRKTDVLNEKRPRRIAAARMLEALEVMKNENKSPYIDKLYQDGKAGFKPLLERVEKDLEADPSDLLALVDNNPPAAKELFKGVADSTVKAPNRKE
jgi:hypothetical protein